VRAKEEEEANRLKEDAILLEKLGCFALVVEKIPATLAKEVAQSIKIPVIGIGAGNGVDGQVLVVHDMLGMTHEFNPRFLRRYLNLYDDMKNAVSQYVSDVKSLDFPNENEQY
jgi:3-methyl-2-oxobutanoate hydroxymethyltransferase